MPALKAKNADDKILWGQFHFFPNGSISVAAHLDKESQQYILKNTYNYSLASSMAGGLPASTAASSILTADHTSPLVLMPSSYDLNVKEDEVEERCFTCIIVVGSIVLLVTASASIGLIFGFI